MPKPSHDVPTLYSALSHPPVCAAGNEVDLTIYRDPGHPTYGAFEYEAPADGLVQVGPPHGRDTRWTREFEIAWTNGRRIEEVVGPVTERGEGGGRRQGPPPRRPLTEQAFSRTSK